MNVVYMSTGMAASSHSVHPEAAKPAQVTTIYTSRYINKDNAGCVAMRLIPRLVKHFLFQTPQSNVEWVVALYDYTGQSEDDLSFQQGDSILVIQHLDDGWSSGRLNGREGLFPRAFVETSGTKILTCLFGSCDIWAHNGGSNSECSYCATLWLGNKVLNSQWNVIIQARRLHFLYNVKYLMVFF